MRRARRVAPAALAVCCLAAGLLPLVDSEQPLVAVAQSLTWPWLALAMLGAGVALLLRAWVSAGALVVAALLICVTLVTPASGSTCAAADGPVLRVLSLNTKLGGADQQQILSQVRSRRIDLLVLLEANTGQVAALRTEGLGRRFPYTASAQLRAYGGTGTIIWSRYRLQRVAAKTRRSMGEPAVWVDDGGARVLVRAVHTYPPIPGWTHRWRAGLRALGAWQRSERGVPIVVLGDFNSSRAHPGFRDAARGLADASGRITHPTWPADVWYGPFTTIDHILVRGLAFSGFTTVKIHGTDHRGVTATLRVCRAGA